MLQELLTVQPTYGRHYTFQNEPKPFPEASGEIPPHAIPGSTLLIRAPNGVYETSVDLPKNIKPGDKYKLTWSVQLHKVTMNNQVGKQEKFPVMLPDGRNIQLQNLTKKILKKGDTIDVWVQKRSVNFTQQPANNKLQKARQQLKMCEEARKELEKKLKTCEKSLEETSLL